jgi:hypothetical protein
MSEPAGFTALSRWLSEAIPPVKDAAKTNFITISIRPPAGVAAGFDPAGVAHWITTANPGSLDATRGYWPASFQDDENRRRF